ncbi:MAG: hypothetical protein ISF22_07845 [Methanomassiliicoccus sp.]|nr:hypothetical protein [Methanomassiliicoccus sp.]
MEPLENLFSSSFGLGTMAEDKCGVAGCSEPAVKSYSREAVEKAGLKAADEKNKRMQLCKEHNKQYKKVTKDERKLENLGR